MIILNISPALQARGWRAPRSLRDLVCARGAGAIGSRSGRRGGSLRPPRWAAWLRRSGPFLQIGGLAVAASARGSALAPMLFLAANAFMRAKASRFGVIFGSERTAEGWLYEAAGCAPMALGPGLLPPLPDLIHGGRALVMRCEPYAVRPDLAPQVVELHADFLEAQALELLAAH